MFETERLILRKWNVEDAESLYEYAKDPDVGPIAGWPVHTSVENSRDIVANVLNGTECYAICDKDSGKAIGSIELMMKGHSRLVQRDDECELGFWIGKPFWGRGYMKEAADCILTHAFNDIGLNTVWCGYYDGNTKSASVQEKIGFRFDHMIENEQVPLLKEERKVHVNVMHKEDWLNQK